MSHRLRVLIVEDREADAELLLLELRRAFTPIFERVETAEGMRAALERGWDVVISDWAMPRFDAMQALALLKERHAELPFIIVSGTLGEETAVTAMRAGARDFLAKGKLARLNAAIERELREAAARRAAQQAINQLSTPVLQVREGLLIVPVIGTIDRSRATQLTEQLLAAIRTRGAKAVVIDITGVPTVDSAIARHLVASIDAARLVGAKAVLTGVSSDVARALVELGVELPKGRLAGDLQAGIEHAERLLGYQVVATSISDHEP